MLHPDLKPENLLFRDINEDADIMVADFGLSRIMEDEKLTKLTEICGTPGVSFPPPCPIDTLFEVELICMPCCSA